MIQMYSKVTQFYIYILYIYLFFFIIGYYNTEKKFKVWKKSELDDN